MGRRPLALLGVGAVVCAAAASAATPLQRVSSTAAGGEPNADSLDPSLSADGRFVAFSSVATDIVPVAPPMIQRIYLEDRLTRHVIPVASAFAGGFGRTGGWGPRISANGRWIAFCSPLRLVASDRVPVGGTTDQITPYTDVYLWDRLTHRTMPVSVDRRGRPANGNSCGPSVSADGRFVAFTSESPKLAPGGRPGWAHLLLWDRLTRHVTQMDVSSAGTPGNGGVIGGFVSGGGRYVVFCGGSTNLVPGVAREDVYLHDRVTQKTTRVARGPCYSQPSLSADGRFVEFTAAPLVAGLQNAFADIYVLDRATGNVRLATPVEANAPIVRGTLSIGGTAVVFTTEAANLVAGDDNNGATDVFVTDLRTGRTTMADTDAGGSPSAAGYAEDGALSADGRTVAFDSTAPLLGPHTVQRENVYARSTG